MIIHRKRVLPRLPSQWYQGNAFVFWTHTIEKRATGWLSPDFHQSFREILAHACGRYHLICAAYCLMPDHFHLVWLGLRANSNQQLATAFLRKHTAPLLNGACFQRQPHDHVLREAERERDSFVATCRYILDNPIRAGLCRTREAYPFQGAIAIGYPRFDPRSADYWEKFWTIYYRLRDEAP